MESQQQREKSKKSGKWNNASTKNATNVRQKCCER